MKIEKLKTFLLVLSVLGASHTTEALDNQTHVVVLSEENFEKELDKNPLLVMIHLPG